MTVESNNKTGYFQYTKGNLYYLISISNMFDSQYVSTIVQKSDRWVEFRNKQLSTLNSTLAMNLIDVNLNQK